MVFPASAPVTFFTLLVSGTITAIYAKQTGKNPYLWFLLGSVLGIAGIFFLFLAPKAQQKSKSNQITLLPTSKELFWYYLDYDNCQRGPFGFDVLRRALLDGKITSQTYVWNPTLDQWQPLMRFISQP